MPASISNLALGFGSSGIENEGFLTLDYDSIMNNSDVGINNSGFLGLSYSTVSGNSNSGAGGGILNNGGALTLNFDTIAGNTSGDAGGGILLENGGTVRISNTTISGNTAGSGYGGGIANDQTSPSSLNLFAAILSGNIATAEPLPLLHSAGDYDGPQYTDLGGGNVIGGVNIAGGLSAPSVLNPNPISVSVQILMTSASGTCSLLASWAADTHYMAATATQTTKAATIAPTVVLSLSSNAISCGVSETFTATLPSAATGTVTFLNNGTTVIGTAPVISGAATFTTSTPLGAGSYSITATYSGDSNYSSAISSALTLTVSKAMPVVAQWPAASSITYGQPLSDSQLTGGNASVGGGFDWTLPNTVLNAGTQLASVTFIPFDQTNYSTVIGSVPVLVSPANLVVTVSSDDAGTASNCMPQASAGHGTDASCSLRDALLESAAAGGGNISFDSIKFSSTTTITLTTNTTLTVPNATTITGATSGSGATLTNLIAVDGNKQTTVFTVGSGVTASISNLIIQNGNPYAGGINNEGTLTLNSDTITKNAGSGSGAIWNSRTLALIASTVSGNSQGCTGCLGGGAITNVDGTLTLINDTITASFANSSGANGIVSDSPSTSIPSVSITDSTISGDSALAGAREIAAFGFANLMCLCRRVAMSQPSDDRIDQ